MSKYRIVTSNHSGVYGLEVEKVWVFGKLGHKYWRHVCHFACYSEEKEELVKSAKEELAHRATLKTVPGKVIVEFEYESNR